MRGLFALVAGAVALTAACAEPTASPVSMPGPTPATAGAASPTPAATEEPAEAPPELRFTEPRLGGGTVRGADFAGHDLVMWFWAPW
jgi:hypothetical protein